MTLDYKCDVFVPFLLTQKQEEYYENEQDEDLDWLWDFLCLEFVSIDMVFWVLPVSLHTLRISLSFHLHFSFSLVFTMREGCQGHLWMSASVKIWSAPG